jgi:hypothetical protein
MIKSSSGNCQSYSAARQLRQRRKLDQDVQCLLELQLQQLSSYGYSS